MLLRKWQEMVKFYWPQATHPLLSLTMERIPAGDSQNIQLYCLLWKTYSHLDLLMISDLPGSSLNNQLKLILKAMIELEAHS